MLEKYKNILVEIDGSKQSFEALKRALHIAKRDNAKLTAVVFLNTCQSLLRTVAIDVSHDLRKLANAQDDLKYCQSLAEKENFSNMDSLVLEGRSKLKTLNNYIKENDIDLFFAGSQRLSILSYLLRDSIPARLADSTDCDVSIVK